MSEPREPEPRPQVRDRRILGIAGLIVVVVLAVSLLSVLIPPLGDAIRSLPVVVLLLVVVTVAVLIPAIRGARKG
ncbi:MAG: hypothetical protein ACRDQC_10715 [Gaiellales bacterium]